MPYNQHNNLGAMVNRWVGFVSAVLGKVRGTAGCPGGTRTGMKGQMMETAVFGAGCFWGVEDAFRHVEGVASTRVGYAGGKLDNPNYEDVCGGRSGHTEVVEVTFDPAVVSYQQLLDTFWKVHDPTLQHKAQYKSVIFYNSDAQRATAVAAKERLAASGTVTIVTDILPAPIFYPAEGYHQQYYEKRGISGSCQS